MSNHRIAPEERPRRWRLKLTPPNNRLFGREREYIYGCYFPSSDLNTNEAARAGTGPPIDVEWLDLETDYALIN